MHMTFNLPDVFNGFNTIFLDIIAIISIIAGVFIIISKNPIVSVLNLILLFSSISSFLIFIGLTFIALAYLLVYVGAVSILFLFILMLINIRTSELYSNTKNNLPLGIISTAGLYIPISTILPEISYNNNYQDILRVSSNNWENKLVDIYDIISVGNVMYTNLSIWLIITSIILLLAMVGSIVITIKQKY